MTNTTIVIDKNSTKWVGASHCPELRWDNAEQKF